MINKYQTGGAAPQDQQAQIQQAIMQISQATGEQPETIVAALKNGKENFKKVIEALQQGNIQAAKQMIQQLAGTPMARLGIKLNYIRSLKGACPEGQEVKYFKEGGRMKCKCVDKAAGGEKVSGKKEIESFKKKKACGGLKAKFQPGGKARTKAQQREIDKQSEEDAINGTYGLNKKEINKLNNPKQKTETRGGLKRTITYREPVEKNDTTFTRNNKVSSNNFGDRNKFKKDEKEFKKATKHFYGGSLNRIPFINMGVE